MALLTHHLSSQAQPAGWNPQGSPLSLAPRPSGALIFPSLSCSNLWYSNFTGSRKSSWECLQGADVCGRQAASHTRQPPCGQEKHSRLRTRSSAPTAQSWPVADGPSLAYNLHACWKHEKVLHSLLMLTHCMPHCSSPQPRNSEAASPGSHNDARNACYHTRCHSPHHSSSRRPGLTSGVPVGGVERV